LDKSFKSKPIKRGVKSHFNSPRNHSNSKNNPSNKMSSQITNNNTYTMASTSPNPYISRKSNNMDQAQVMKREREDWSRLYHKMLKELETMIDIQRWVKDIKELAEEVNITIMEVEGLVLMANINNRVTNTTNITQISEDLQYIVQSDMDKQAFQV